MGMERDGWVQPVPEGPCPAARSGGGDAPGKRQSMDTAGLPQHPFLAVPASSTCRDAALGRHPTELSSPVKDFPFSLVSIALLLRPRGAAAYFPKGRGIQPFAPPEPPCIPSPHRPDLHINVLSLVG